MSAVQIAGCSGAGKSTIAAVLARRGLTVIDADNDPLLAREVDATGAVVDEPAEPDLAWLARHSWAWNPARLDELIRAAAPATLYVCGGADNQLEMADRFTRVFLLEIDEPTMLARIAARQDNDWGQIGDTREYLRRKLPELQARLRASGAIPIDARQPVDQVVDAILAHTLASSDAGRASTPGDLPPGCAPSHRDAADRGVAAGQDQHRQRGDDAGQVEGAQGGRVPVGRSRSGPALAREYANVTASATSTWAAMNAIRPSTPHRRFTIPNHMPYTNSADSPTNEVSQVAYQGPLRRYGTRKKVMDSPQPPVARSMACSPASTRPDTRDIDTPSSAVPA